MRCKVRTIGLILILSVTIFPSRAQTSFRAFPIDPQGHIRETQTDFEHLLLDVSFDTKAGKVFGKATHTFRAIRAQVDTIFLDGINMTFKEVKLDGIKVRNRVTPEGIIIYPPKSLSSSSGIHTLYLDYECTPQKGIYFIGWNDPLGKARKQIWTQGEGIDNRHWIPGHDDFYDKLVTEMVVTFPEPYQVLSNGSKREEKKVSGGMKRWHYKMPHPHGLYLVMLGIGEYTIAHEKSQKGQVPLENYMYPDWKERMEPTYRYTSQIMDFFEQETGVKYQWGSYAQIPVQDFLYGAMENTSATIFGDFFCVNDRMYRDRSYVSVNAHEMAHQWFGDLITCRSNKDMWLQESFATQYAKLAERHLFGEDHYDQNRRNEQNTALDASKANNNPIASNGAGTARIYQKGSFVIDMLRYVVGNEDYRRTVTHYLNRFSFKNVETYDFMIAFHDVAGYNLDWFFDQWLYHGGEPEYKVSYEARTDVTEFRVKQVQARNELIGLFRMPIQFEVWYTDGTRDTVRPWIEHETETISIPNPKHKAVDYVLFDPDNHILKQVTFEKPREMLIVQSMKAQSILDRFDALAAMSHWTESEKINIQTSIYNRESFIMLKAEVLKQLGGSTSPAGMSLIRKGLEDSNPKIRLAAVRALPLDAGHLEMILQAGHDSSDAVAEAALSKLAGNPALLTSRQIESFRNLGPGFDHQLRISFLRLAIETDPNASAYKSELISLANTSQEFRTRKNAMDALQQLNLLDDPQLISYIADALLSKNGRLSGPAQAVISNYQKLDQNRTILRKWLEANKSTYSASDYEKLKLLAN